MNSLLILRKPLKKLSSRCRHLQLLYQEFTDPSVDTRHLEKPNSDTGEDSPDHSWSRLVGMDNGFIFQLPPTF
jgi:hypothetical protein